MSARKAASGQASAYLAEIPRLRDDEVQPCQVIAVTLRSDNAPSRVLVRAWALHWLGASTGYSVACSVRRGVSGRCASSIYLDEDMKAFEVVGSCSASKARLRFADEASAAMVCVGLSVCTGSEKNELKSPTEVGATSPLLTHTPLASVEGQYWPQLVVGISAAWCAPPQGSRGLPRARQAGFAPAPAYVMRHS